MNGSVSYPGTVNEWFNTSIFSSPAIGQWGNLGYGALWGPGRFNTNLSLFKSFVLSEKRGSKLELRVESFNIFNHTQFLNPDGNISDGVDFGQVKRTRDPRNIQFALKFAF